MIPERFRSPLAQTQAEYAIVVASIAIALIVAVLYFGGTVTGLWDRNSEQASVFYPPDSDDPPPSTTTFDGPPKTAADCDKWATIIYPKTFTDKGECLAYVASLP